PPFIFTSDPSIMPAIEALRKRVDKFPNCGGYRRVLNRFGESWPEMRRKPGTDTNFRRSLPEFGCLSQGLPNGTGCTFVVSPKRLSTSSDAQGGALCHGWFTVVRNV